jgi:hypothetical protein
VFGLLAYAFAALVVAGALSALVGFFTRVGSSVEKGAGLRILIAWLVCFAGPYVWVEANTAKYAADLEPVVDEAIQKSKIEPDVQFVKVQYAWKDRAKLIVVAKTEEHEWGSYRNLYAVTAVKDGEYWELDEVIPINTEDGDSAGFSIPPYW